METCMSLKLSWRRSRSLERSFGVPVSSAAPECFREHFRAAAVEAQNVGREDWGPAPYRNPLPMPLPLSFIFFFTRRRQARRPGDQILDVPGIEEKPQTPCRLL